MRSARALEAILFAAGDSVETERIAKVLGAEPWDVRPGCGTACERI